MRLFLAAAMCLAVGFGVGWAVFETPWEGNRQRLLDETAIEDLSVRSNPRIKDADCVQDHGPFYSCILYSGELTGRFYTMEVARNRRCFTGRVHDPNAPIVLPNDDPVRIDQSLPMTIRGQIGTDC